MLQSCLLIYRRFRTLCRSHRLRYKRCYNLCLEADLLVEGTIFASTKPLMLHNRGEV